MTITRFALAIGFAVLASSSSASAQTTAPVTGADPDARWAPWLGCWELTDESVDEGESTMARLFGMPAPRTDANAGALVCVTPGKPAGATLTTLVNDQAVLTETIVADATERALTEPDCRGWQRAEWSQLGARLYASAELTCDGQATRRASGMSLMTAGPIWIDIQMIESDGRKSLRVRRYKRSANQKHAAGVPSLARQSAAMPLSSRLSIADVKEAAAKVVPEALQAALLELKAGFDLKGKHLVELDEAGVADSITDLMVALSYPQRFVVERSTRTGWGGGGGGDWGPLSPFWGSGFEEMWPYFVHPSFFTSYFAPFGYRYWGRYDPYYFSGPGFVEVSPGSGTPAPIQASGEGRVVDGFGYTRVRRNEPEPSRRSDGTVVNADGSRSSNSGSSGSTSTSSSGVSSSGYSSGGASSGGERTAQPRPPGH